MIVPEYYIFQEFNYYNIDGNVTITSKIIGHASKQDINDCIDYCTDNYGFNKLERDGWSFLERDSSLTIFDINHPKIRVNCKMGIEAYERDILRKKIKEFIND